MRPKIILLTIGGAALLLLAIWSIAPQAPVTNPSPQPQPKTAGVSVTPNTPAAQTEPETVTFTIRPRLSTTSSVNSSIPKG